MFIGCFGEIIVFVVIDVFGICIGVGGFFELVVDLVFLFVLLFELDKVKLMIGVDVFVFDLLIEDDDFSFVMWFVGGIFDLVGVLFFLLFELMICIIFCFRFVFFWFVLLLLLVLFIL